MTTGLKRHPITPLLATLLPVAVGIAWYLWHSRVNLCGYRGLKGEPSFPEITALIVLAPFSSILTAISGFVERRSLRSIAGLVLLSAVLSGLAIATAELAFISNRHCFE